MPTYYPASTFVTQYVDTNGVPLVGGSIRAYLANTTTPAVMYSDDAGTAIGSTVTLNARGEPEVSGNTVLIWLDAAVTYKFTLNDASGVVIWTIDDIIDPSVVGSVNTVTDLQSLPVPAANTSIEVLGYYTPGDGGGGTFYWNAASTAAANSGTIFVPYGYVGTGRWHRLYIGARSVRWFGATGDDLTDDYPAFDACINAYPGDGASGGEIFIPDGSYYLSTRLNIDRNLTIKGSNAGTGRANNSCRLVFAADTDGLVFFGSDTPGRPHPTYGDIGGSILENVYIQQTAGSTTFGQGISFYQPVTIRNVYVDGFFQDGIWANGTAPNGDTGGWSIENTIVDGCGRYGLHVEGGSAPGLATNLRCLGNVDAGIYDVSSSGNSYDQCYVEAGTGDVSYHVVSPSGFFGAQLRNCSLLSGAGVTSVFGPEVVIIGGLVRGEAFGQGVSLGYSGGASIGTPDLTSITFFTGDEAGARRELGEIDTFGVAQTFAGYYTNEVAGRKAELYRGIIRITNGTAGAEYCAQFNNTNGTVGTITTTGSATAYNTTSDYRLKENAVDIIDGVGRLKELNPVRFNFRADTSIEYDGFLAHEVADVVPEAVTGSKDAVDDEGNPIYQGIDQSKLVPLLTAALLELIARVEALENP